ncbi:MAG: DoxX family protein [Candidatus Nealsonbacteria bacterium]|nr:DoxX family protein [Candidatus Nealsonbacteria bacterium]
MIFPQLAEFSDLGLFLLRLAVGIIFLVHGTSKFGSWGPSPEKPGMKGIMRTLSVVEPLSAIAIILGFYTQAAALILAAVMTGAIYFKIFVWKKKFTEPGGWELDFIILASNIAIFLTGGGIELI